jgi:hypothetical protein
MSDPLRYTFEEARRQQLRDGIALSTAAKVAWFEEMVTLAVRFGARDRLADRRDTSLDDDRLL